MTDLSLHLPLSIRVVAEVVVVEDNAKTIASYIYFEDEPGRR